MAWVEQLKKGYRGRYRGPDGASLRAEFGNLQVRRITPALIQTWVTRMVNEGLMKIPFAPCPVDGCRLSAEHRVAFGWISENRELKRRLAAQEAKNA